MDSYSHYKCWEIMNCDNLDCLARCEPEIPCWEIARKAEAYHDISNTCSDCIVYKLKHETIMFNIKREYHKNRVHLKNIGAGHQGCI